MACETRECPFRANRPLIATLLTALGLSILFSALPFICALALDKSSLALGLLMAWYPAIPPAIILLISLWIMAGRAPWLRALGAVLLGICVWFLLQYLFTLLSGLSVLFKLFALPAVFTGSSLPFLIAGLIFLAAGIVLYIAGKSARAPQAKPGLAWVALALLVILALCAVPLKIAFTTNPAIKAPAAGSLPSTDKIFSYISEVYNLGERLPGSEADHNAISYLESKLKGFGFTDVRVEKSNFDYWVPSKWGIEASPGTAVAWQPESFYVPYSGPAAAGGTTAEVVYLGSVAAPAKADVKGKIVLVDIPPTDVSWDQMKLFSYMAYEPEKQLKGWAHPYPIGWMMKYDSFYDKIEKQGPAGIISILRGYPEMGKFTYYAPYQGILRHIPSMYLMQKDGDRLKEQAAAGKTDVKLTLDAQVTPMGGESANVYALLPGQSDRIIMFHSHHDAPWRSGVEDSSGVGMVLALAEYYAKLPLSERPYSMMFLFTGGHMVGGHINDVFVEKHRTDLVPRILFDIAIEHVSDDYRPPEPPTGAEPRGVFITENPVTVSLYERSVEQAGLSRTLVFPTGTPLGVPTDAQHFGRAGIPVVSMIAGPVWLFDDDDTLERVHKPSLAPMAGMYVNFSSRLGATPPWMLGPGLAWLAPAMAALLALLAALFLAYRKK